MKYKIRITTCHESHKALLIDLAFNEVLWQHFIENKIHLMKNFKYSSSSFANVCKMGDLLYSFGIISSWL